MSADLRVMYVRFWVAKDADLGPHWRDVPVSVGAVVDELRRHRLIELPKKSGQAGQ